MNKPTNIEKFWVETLFETQRIALNFANKIQTGDIIVLSGDLGVGKTEFVKSICKELGVEDTITSPSFTLINQYKPNQSRFYNTGLATIFHIDLYRISRQNELNGLGFNELFDTPNAIFFIEWAENSYGMLPYVNWVIRIEHKDTEESRIIEIMSYL